MIYNMNDIDRNNGQFEQLLVQLSDVHKEVSLSVNQSELNESLTRLMSRSEAELTKSRQCIDRLKWTTATLIQQMDKLSPVLTSVGPLLDKLERLTQLDRLLDLFDIIKHINLSLETNVANGRNAKDSEIRVMAIIQAFNKLVHQYKALNESDRNEEIKAYLFNIIEYWKKVLYEKFEKKFIETFEGIDWPKTGDEQRPEPSPDSINLFKLYFNALLTIDIDNKLISDESRNLLSKRIVLPMQLMLRPIKKRFQYHFMEAKSKLNRYEKVISLYWLIY